MTEIKEQVITQDILFLFSVIYACSLTHHNLRSMLEDEEKKHIKLCTGCVSVSQQ